MTGGVTPGWVVSRGAARLRDGDALEELLVVLEHLFERRGGVVVEVRRGAADPAQARDVEVLDVARAAGDRVAGEQHAARIRVVTRVTHAGWGAAPPHGVPLGATPLFVIS